MSRVLALGCFVAAAFFLFGSPAWAEDAAPPPPPPPPVENALPEGPTGGGGQVPGGTAALPGTTGTAAEITADSVLRASPPGDTMRRENPWSGSLRLRYRLRAADDSDSLYENDNDVHGYLRVKYRDEELPGLSGSFHGRVSVDLDDFGNFVGFNVWDNITDTYADRINARIYHAYVNYRLCNGPLQDIRLGRMWEDVGEYLTFDGLRLESRKFGRGEFGVAAIVGMPFYLFDDSRSGNFIAGAQVFGKPWRGGEVELDYTYIRNNEAYGDRDDHLVNLVMNQRIGKAALARLQYEHLNEEPRLLRAMVDATWPGKDMVFRGYFNTLFNPQAELVYDLDYYYWTQLDLEPYWDANLSLSKGIGYFFNVEGGVTLRRLYDSADESVYNREWEQYFLAASSYDWLLEGLSLTLSGELWSGSDDVGTVVFDAEYRPSRTWGFVVGSDYAAYSFDLFAAAERQNVVSVFGRVSWRPTEKWFLDARARVEDDDFGTYLVFDLTAQMNF